MSNNTKVAKRKRRKKNRQTRVWAIADKIEPRKGARPYYTIYAMRITGKHPHHRLQWREKRTIHYQKLMDQLLAMCGDMTVDLSAIFQKPQEQPGPNGCLEPAGESE